MFNVSQRTVTELLPLSAFSGILESQDYIARASSSGRVSSPVKPSSHNSLFTLAVQPRGWEIFSLYPLTALPGLKSEVVKVATLGLLDKLTGCAAVMSKYIEKQDNGRLMIDTRLKAFGILGTSFVWLLMAH